MSPRVTVAHPRVLILSAALATLLAAPLPALAHGLAGNRFFPATIATDDPAVADELSLPTVSSQDGEAEFAGEWSKRFTPTFGLSIESAWTRDSSGAPTQTGFQNIGTTLKWQFLTDAPSETILSAGLSAEWGGTGSRRVGAEDTTVVTPTFYFGKGFGGAAQDWVKPFAVTGLIGYAMPTSGRDKAGGLNPSSITGGLAFEYSLPYLNAHVRDHGWPGWVNQLTPLVEVAFERPVHNAGGEGLTGSVNPGVLWTGRRVQLGGEAIVPMNGDSGRGVGWAVQAHFFLDDIFPKSLGKPLFGAGQ